MFSVLTKLPAPTKDQAVYCTVKNLQAEAINMHITNTDLYDIVSHEYDKIKHRIHSQADWIAFSSDLLLENTKCYINMKWN